MATMQRISPLTGKMTTYTQTISNMVYDHQTAPDLETLKNNITNELLTQQHDAYCDKIALVQGLFTDTAQPSIWIAQPLQATGTQTLIDPFTAVAVWSICKTILAIVLVAGTIIALWAIKSIIWGDPKKYIDPNNPNVTITWEQLISAQNAKFWYVCAKDGYGVGERAKYPNITDVPQAEIDAFTDHCVSAPDISDKGNEITSTLVLVGGVLVAIAGIWLVGQMFKR